MADTLKLLVTDTAPLTPVRWGGPHRIFHLFTNLPQNFEVTYVGIDLDATEPRTIQVNERFTEVIVPPSRLFPAVRKVQMTLLREESIDLYSYIAVSRDRPYRDAILKHAADCDILVASHPWGFPALVRAHRRARRNGLRKMLVYDSHNCEYPLQEKILASCSKLLTVPILAELKRIEQQAVRESRLVLACSPQDEVDFVRFFNADKTKMRPLPNSVPVRGRRSARDKKKARDSLGIAKGDSIAFFIGAYYKPNIEAFEAILELAATMQDYRFHIAGSVSLYPDFRQDPKPIPGNVVLHGIVDDERFGDLLTAADVALNPTFTGGGTQIKMLDYFAAGLPVVSTEHGSRGLDVQHNKHLFVAQPSGFKQMLERVAGEPELAKGVGAAARSFIAQHYSAKVLGSRLGEYLERAWKGAWNGEQ